MGDRGLRPLRTRFPQNHKIVILQFNLNLHTYMVPCYLRIVWNRKNMRATIIVNIVMPFTRDHFCLAKDHADMITQAVPVVSREKPLVT